MGKVTAFKQIRKERQRKAWELRQRGFTLLEIGKELGISAQGARSVLVTAERKHVENMDRSIDAVKVRNTAILEYIRSLALRAYEQSCLPCETVRTTHVGAQPENECDHVKIDESVWDETEDGFGPSPLDALPASKGPAKQAKRRAEIRIERIQRTPYGDPSLLREARECTAEIGKIWGVNAPLQREIKTDAYKRVDTYSENLHRIYGKSPIPAHVPVPTNSMPALDPPSTDKQMTPYPVSGE